MQPKCRNELKMIAHERGTPRDINSSTRLADFKNAHAETFDLLWSAFACTLSATRITESAHGFQRESWDSQRSFLRNDAQLRHVMKTVYKFRQARRRVVYERTGKGEDEDKIERKAPVKHCNRKCTAVMVSEQLMKFSTHCSKLVTEERISPEEMKANRIVNTKNVD